MIVVMQREQFGEIVEIFMHFWLSCLLCKRLEQFNGPIVCFDVYFGRCVGCVVILAYYCV